MATGSAFNGKCYSTVQDATDAYYSTYTPMLTSGAVSYLTQFQKIDGIWKSVTYEKAASDWVQQSVQVVPALTFPACDSAGENFQDGVTMGWLITLTLIMAWGFNRMREQAR